MGVYALLVIVVFGVALSFAQPGDEFLEVSGGLLWALIVFTSLLGLNRSFAAEKENGCIEGLLLAPIDRGALFLAKATSNLVFLLVVEVVAVPLFWFFFSSFADPAPTALFRRGADYPSGPSAWRAWARFCRPSRSTRAAKTCCWRCCSSPSCSPAVRVRVRHHGHHRRRGRFRGRVRHVACACRCLRCGDDPRLVGPLQFRGGVVTRVATDLRTRKG